MPQQEGTQNNRSPEGHSRLRAEELVANPTDMWAWNYLAVSRTEGSDFEQEDLIRAVETTEEIAQGKGNQPETQFGKYLMIMGMVHHRTHLMTDGLRIITESVQPHRFKHPEDNRRMLAEILQEIAQTNLRPDDDLLEHAAVRVTQVSNFRTETLNEMATGNLTQDEMECAEDTAAWYAATKCAESDIGQLLGQDGEQPAWKVEEDLANEMVLELCEADVHSVMIRLRRARETAESRNAG